MVAGLTIADIDNSFDSHYFVMSDGSLKLESKNPVIPVQKQTGSTEFQPWGSDNREPFKIWDEGNAIIEIQSGLDLKSRLLYGNGFIVGRVIGVNPDGSDIFEPIFNKEINNYLKNAGFAKYLMDAATNFYWFNIVFPNIVLTKDRKKIAFIKSLDSTECRFEKQNKNSGLIDHVFISANWRLGNNPEDLNKVPVINPFYPEYFLENDNSFSYIYPLAYATPGSKYYPVASWSAVRKSGWLNVAKKIPEFKTQLFENQLAVKYHIETTKQWWEWKYPGFDKLSASERIDTIKRELNNFENTMTGNNGAGKSVVSTGYVDDRSGNYIPGWKINTLSNKFGSGDYIEDSQEATSKVIAGLGIPSSLLNLLGTGSKMGGGSGTDIRVAFNLYINSIESHRDLILEPWNFALRYNGFGDDLKIKLRYKQISTLENRQETVITD